MEASRAVARRADDLVRRCHAGLCGTAFQAEVVRALPALLPVDRRLPTERDARDLGPYVASVPGSVATRESLVLLGSWRYSAASANGSAVNIVSVLHAGSLQSLMHGN